jgi:streptomycin 6-kinase
MPAENAFGADLAFFRNLEDVAEARGWLRALPALVVALEREWEIQTRAPYEGCSTSWTAPATRGDGSPAVLKINWPHDRARHEIDGLECWDGHGAVALYRSDRSRWAFLIEQCAPGTALSRMEFDVDTALRAVADVARRLWRPAPADSSLPSMAAVTRSWAELVRTRFDRHQPAFDHGLVELGASLLETLSASGSRDVVLHGDLNPRNILRARRHPWLAIDPQPLVGDPAFDPPAVIAQVAPPSDEPMELARRYRLFSDLTGLTVERMAAWAVARFVEASLRQFERGHTEWARHAIEIARVYAGLAKL